MPPDVERLLRQGSRDSAFQAIVDYYQTKVFRLVYSVVFDSGAAEDLTQEVLLKVWQALDSYDWRSPFATWLYTIARNTAINHLRRESYRRTDALDGAREPRAPTSSDGVEIAEMRRMVDRLPSDQRDVIVLFYLQERSVAEVARMLDLAEGTVKSYLFRARKNLASMMEVKQ